MAVEIERKFLVVGDYKSESYASSRITQGYLNSNPERTVRVRIKGEKAFITIKGSTGYGGTTRFEWEKEIDVKDAENLLLLCENGVIDKTRYYVKEGNHIFEIDEFHGDNEGLVVAEVELKSVDEDYEHPSWLGVEVTGDARYYNSMIAIKPFKSWE